MVTTLKELFTECFLPQGAIFKLFPNEGEKSRKLLIPPTWKYSPSRLTPTKGSFPPINTNFHFITQQKLHF